MDAVNINPAKHFVMRKDWLDSAISAIRSELLEWLDVLNSEGKLLEAQRLEQRTNYHLECRPRWASAMGLRTMPAIQPGGRRAHRRSFWLIPYPTTGC